MEGGKDKKNGCKYLKCKNGLGRLGKLEDLIKERKTAKTLEDAEITEYSYKLFYFLRKLDGIEAQDIYDSFNLKANKAALSSISESKGKSGSFFFFTHDRRFVLKTMYPHECKTFDNMLEAYYKHIFKTNPNSLICRMYGCYGYKSP